MRFNFITIYSDRVVPIFSPSPSSKHITIGLRGALEPVSSHNFSAFFGPISSAFDSNDFAFFSKIFKKRNSYLSDFFAKRMRYFGLYSDFAMYERRTTTTFEKNVVLYKMVKNFRYNSIIFRANGFRFGSLALKKISTIRAKFFQFFRNFNFYKLFARLVAPVFISRAQTNKFFLNFLNFLKSSFFRYFSGFAGPDHQKKLFRGFSRYKAKFLRKAFLLFFFFQREINAHNRGFCLTSVSSFYLSEAVFFSSRFGFQKKAARRFLPLSSYLFSIANLFFYAAT